METTIQISSDLLKKLKSMKMNDKESYENIIWDLIEDNLELSGETKLNIEKSKQEIKDGNIVSFEDIKRKIKARNVHN